MESIRVRKVLGFILVLWFASAFAGCISRPAAEPVEAPSTIAIPAPQPTPAPVNATVPPPAPAPVVDPHAGLPRLQLGSGGGTSWGTPLFWHGMELQSSSNNLCATCLVMPRDPEPCGPANCQTIPFNVSLPAGYWANRTGDLVVSITWSHDNPEQPWFALKVLDGEGKLAGESYFGLYSQVVTLPNATAGNYAAVVQGYGRGAYFGAIQIEAAPKDPGPPRDLLPDLVTMKPTDLKVWLDGSTLFLPWPGGLVPDGAPPEVQGLAFTALGLPFGVLASGPGGSTAMPQDAVRALAAAGIKGCDPFEAANGARRCLRFSNFIGNAGEGIMEVRFTRDASQTHVPPPGAVDFTQRVYNTDGSYRDQKAGNGSYHFSHGHLHYNGIAAYTLHKYDLAAHARGEQVGQQAKAGWCFGNEGLVMLGSPYTRPAQDGNCDVFGPATELPQYLYPNWFDGYESYRPEQFIEITGLADGVYELVSVADPDNSVQEGNEGNNEASTVFKLTGDQVEVLQ